MANRYSTLTILLILSYLYPFLVLKRVPIQPVKVIFLVFSGSFLWLIFLVVNPSIPICTKVHLCPNLSGL